MFARVLLAILTWFNRAFSKLLDTLLFPFESFPPVIGLTVVALATAVGMLLVFRATTNQTELARVKRRIHAAFFEIRLFNDNLRVMLRAVADVFRQNLAYLGLALPAILLSVVPLAALIAHLHAYYGYEGLVRGHTALLKVRLKSGISDVSRTPSIDLQAPSGIHVDTPLLWIPSEREAAWRIRAEQDGDYQVKVALTSSVASKEVRVFNGVGRRAPERLQRGLLAQLLSPAETPLSLESPFESIVVTYPTRAVNIFGWDVHWMIVFTTLLIAFTLAVKTRFHVVV